MGVHKVGVGRCQSDVAKHRELRVDTGTVYRGDRRDVDTIDKVLDVLPSIHHSLKDVIRIEVKCWLWIEPIRIACHPFAVGAGEDQNVVFGIVSNVLPHSGHALCAACECL